MTIKNPNKFDVPGLDDKTVALYSRLYGDAGDRFTYILSTSPSEIAVLSRLIACLKSGKEDSHAGSAEDSQGDRAV